MLYVLSSRAPSRSLELITCRHEAILSVAFSTGKVRVLLRDEVPLTIKLSAV